MFENIGGKLKILAKIVTVLGIGASLFAGIYFTVTGRIELWQGVTVLIGGPFLFWIISAYTYGFGELVERTAEIAYNTRDVASPLPPHLTGVRMSRRQKRRLLEKWHEDGLISGDEYRKKLAEIRD